MNVRSKIQDVSYVSPTGRTDMSSFRILEGWTIYYLVPDQEQSRFYRHGVDRLGGIGIGVTTAAGLHERLERGGFAWTIVLIDLGFGRSREAINLASQCRNLCSRVQIVTVIPELDMGSLGILPKGVKIELRPKTISRLSRMVDRAQEEAVVRDYESLASFDHVDHQDESAARMVSGWWLIPMIMLGGSFWAWLAVTLWRSLL